MNTLPPTPKWLIDHHNKTMADLLKLVPRQPVTK